MIWTDVESVGLTGPAVLVQWAKDGGPVQLFHPFHSTAGESVRVVEQICADVVGGFNLTFDAYKLIQLWAVARLLPPGERLTPKGFLSTWRQAAELGWIIKPPGVLDLFLFARSGPMQALMERDDIRVRRVPKDLAGPLCQELTDRLDLPKIFFARLKEGGQWKVQEDPDDPDFPDVYLCFGAKGGLKPLSEHLLGVQTFSFPLPASLKDPLSAEDEWDPFWLESQPHADALVQAHADYWLNDAVAQRYAVQDVELLSKLHKALNSPPHSSDNDLLTWAVAAARFHGFPMDRLGVVKAHHEASELSLAAPRSPSAVMAGLKARCSEIEMLGIEDTTGETLEAVVKWGDHPAAHFAKKVIDARSAEKRADTLFKLARTRRFHPDFKVVGALSNRMAGAGGLNATGIEKEFTINDQKCSIRPLFLMADDDENLEGGDFYSFEVMIAAAVYKDPTLEAELRSGKKIHGLLGSAMYGKSYEEVMATDKGIKVPGMGWDGNLYAPSKSMMFAWIYGAQTPKLAATGRLTEEATEAGIQEFFSRYPVLAAGRQQDADLFCSMRQKDGGTVYWRDPADKIESLLGWPRYFTLENKLCKLLFDLAKKPPESLRGLKVKVRRSEHKGPQTASGAVMSALYGAAFQIQARNMRAAGNHRIQATGAGITKRLQVEAWHLQPVGGHKLICQLMQVHDELLRAGRVPLAPVVDRVVNGFKSVVPLLRMDWVTGLPSWGGIK